MREDIARIMRLVKEGKLSPEDAAELIDAMQATPEPEEEPVGVAGGTFDGSTPPPPPPPPPPKTDDHGPFGAFIDAIEKVGKEVATGVNWTEVGTQLRKGVKQGADAVRKAAQDIKDGKINFGLFEAETRRVEQPLIVPEGKILRIESINGEIHVVTGEAADGKLVADAIFQGSDREVLKKRAEEFALVVEESDHFVLIRQPDQAGLTVNFAIELPAAVPVEIKSTSGDIAVRGAKGNCRIEATSGDVEIEKIEGSLSVNTASGDIKIRQAALSLLNIDNKSGDMRLVDVIASATLRTASGEIMMERCGGTSLAVDGVSGDLNIDLIQPITGAVSLRTVSGDVSVSVPGNSSVRVNATTLRGDIESRLDLEDENRNERTLTGRLGDGQGTLDVSAVSGSIALHLRESAV